MYDEASEARKVTAFATSCAVPSRPALVRVEFDQGAIGKVHHHPHRQATYVAAGRFEVTVGDEITTLASGDSFFALADVPHGVRALEKGSLIDCFTPAREDFLRARA